MVDGQRLTPFPPISDLYTLHFTVVPPPHTPTQSRLVDMNKNRA